MAKKELKKTNEISIENALVQDLDYPTEKEMRRESYTRKKRK